MDWDILKILKLRKNRVRLVLLSALLSLLPSMVQAQVYTQTIVGGTYDYTDYGSFATIADYFGTETVLSIPDKVMGLQITGIENSVFYGCSNLAIVMIPGSITNIGGGAFANCTNLTGVYFEGNAPSIDDSSVFTNSTNVTVYYVPGTTGWAATFAGRPTAPWLPPAQLAYATNTDDTITVTGYARSNGVVVFPPMINGFPVKSIGDWAFYLSSISNILIPGSVTNLGTGAFDACTNITSITIPDSIIGLGTYVFSSCSSLTNIVVPNSLASISGWAFMDCSKLAGVALPDSVTSIGVAAFQDCYALADFTIPGGVTNIGSSAFEWCTSLTNITLPDGVTTIEPWTFGHCRHLATIIIPNSITNIGAWAFQDCISMTNIIIPESVTNIEVYAFYSCDNLNGVFFNGNAPGFNDSSIFDNSPNATVYYLPGTTGWDAMFAGVPTALWLPQMQPVNINFGNQTNQFGFNINWASDQTVVVEACTNLFNPDWQPLQTNVLTTGSAFFNDSHWTNFSSRFYRVRSP